MSKNSDKYLTSRGNLALKPDYFSEQDAPDEQDEHNSPPEMATNRLQSTRLRLLRVPHPNTDELLTTDLTEPVQNTTDWLKLQGSTSLDTGMLADDNAAMHEPALAGVGSHATPSRIMPTRGARIRTGVRRSTLLALLSALAGGSLVGGGYLLATTPWLATVAGPSQTTQASKPAQAQAPAQSQAPILPQTSEKDDQQAPVQGSQPAPAVPASKAKFDQGVAQYTKGNYNEAISLLESYLLVNSNDPQAYYELGLSYVGATGRAHSLEDAELAFRTATSLQPDWAAPYQGMAESLIKRDYYNQAIAPALKATQIQPAMPDAWMTLGRAYQGAGKTAEATRAFAEAAYLAPQPPLP